MTVHSTPLVSGLLLGADVWRDFFRAVLGGSMGAFAGGIGARNGSAHGVTTLASLAVTQSGTPGMSVDVAAGSAVITGTASALQGPYGFVNDATETLTVAAADATNPRKDLVIAQVRDGDYDGTGVKDARLTVVTGTPAASPSDPSLAAYPNALVLARIDVPATDTAITTAQITDLRTFGGIAGTMPVRDTSPGIAATTVGTSSATFSSLTTAVLPPGIALIMCYGSWLKTNDTDRFVFSFSSDGVGMGSAYEEDGTVGSGVVIRTIPWPTAQAHTITSQLSRVTGGGTASCVTNATRIEMMFFPDR